MQPDSLVETVKDKKERQCINFVVRAAERWIFCNGRSFFHHKFGAKCCIGLLI